MQFNWDKSKNNHNIQKHGFDFKDAAEMFSNGTLLDAEDHRKNYNEIRFVGFGYVKERLMSVVYTKRFDAVRIISFRKSYKREVKVYEKKKIGRN